MVCFCGEQTDGSGGSRQTMGSQFLPLESRPQRVAKVYIPTGANA
jgi:hypothetical protein